jgi:hypothetical protein
MRVHNQEISRIFKDGCVAVQKGLRARDGGINAVGHLLDIEEGGEPVNGLCARMVRAENGLFHQSGAGPAGAESPPQKTAS